MPLSSRNACDVLDNARGRPGSAQVTYGSSKAIPFIRKVQAGAILLGHSPLATASRGAYGRWGWRSKDGRGSDGNRGAGGVTGTDAVAVAETTTEAETPSVVLRNVTKRFDDFTAVDDLSLTLGHGEFFTLLGPSGCGKTTTLRMIAGFERPTSGEISIEGEDVAALPPHKRPTNTVFQSYALFPHLSVEKNVAFGLKRKKVGKDEIAERVATELQRVGLAREAGRRPSQLSGGMQQRVAFARGLGNLATALLLD